VQKFIGIYETKLQGRMEIDVLPAPTQQYIQKTLLGGFFGVRLLLRILLRCYGGFIPRCRTHRRCSRRCPPVRRSHRILATIDVRGTVVDAVRSLPVRGFQCAGGVRVWMLPWRRQRILHLQLLRGCLWDAARTARRDRNRNLSHGGIGRCCSCIDCGGNGKVTGRFSL